MSTYTYLNIYCREVVGGPYWPKRACYGYINAQWDIPIELNIRQLWFLSSGPSNLILDSLDLSLRTLLKACSDSIVLESRAKYVSVDLWITEFWKNIKEERIVHLYIQIHIFVSTFSQRIKFKMLLYWMYIALKVYPMPLKLPVMKPSNSSEVWSIPSDACSPWYSTTVKPHSISTHHWNYTDS